MAARRSFEKGVWSVRERKLGEDRGHANGGKVKVFSREEVAALNRSLEAKKKVCPAGGQGADDSSGVTEP